jgi:hypothetical protein
MYQIGMKPCGNGRKTMSDSKDGYLVWSDDLDVSYQHAALVVAELPTEAAEGWVRHMDRMRGGMLAKNDRSVRVRVMDACIKRIVEVHDVQTCVKYYYTSSIEQSCPLDQLPRGSVSGDV